MKVYLNPGHDLMYDPGAVNPVNGLREADIVARIGKLVAKYLNDVGIETLSRQSDNLYWDSSYSDRNIAVVEEANNWGADIFISIHCNAANGNARGTEQEIYSFGGDSELLANCIQNQIVDSLNTVDRGVKEYPGLIVLKHTTMPAVLIETAFIDNMEDAYLLDNETDEFARAIARAVTDYQLEVGC